MYNSDAFRKACADFLRKDLNVPAVPPLTISSIMDETEEARPSDEQWVWVTGYKGTDRDMKCRDYQFELGKQFDMSKDADIQTCRSGFHLCLKLKDVFDYYDIGNGNRFFEVRALVRKDDAYKYGTMWNYQRVDKLAAKSIEFIRELSVDEILNGTNWDVEDWTTADKLLALEKGMNYARNARNKGELLCMGYSERMVNHFIERGWTELALTLGSQEGLSMDTKIQILFNDA